MRLRVPTALFALALAGCSQEPSPIDDPSATPAPEPALVMGLDGARLTVTKGSEVKNEILKFYEILMQFNPKLLGGKLPDNGFFLA